MKRANKLALLHVRKYPAKPNLTDQDVDHQYQQATTIQGPPRLLIMMDQCGYTAEWSSDGKWHWRDPQGKQGGSTFHDFPAMARCWEQMVWPGLESKKCNLRPANALALMQIRGYDFKVMNSEGTLIAVTHKSMTNEHRGTLTAVVDAYLKDEIQGHPPGVAITTFDAAGFELHKDEEGRWQWYGPEHTSAWFHSVDMALDDWFTQRDAGKLGGEEVLPTAGTPDDKSVRLNALQHYIEDGHRSAARENLPANISVAPDAKVKIAYGDNGRVLGCYVEASIFVSLAPAKA